MGDSRTIKYDMILSVQLISLMMMDDDVMPHIVTKAFHPNVSLRPFKQKINQMFP